MSDSQPPTIRRLTIGSALFALYLLAYAVLYGALRFSDGGHRSDRTIAFAFVGLLIAVVWGVFDDDRTGAQAWLMRRLRRPAAPPKNALRVRGEVLEAGPERILLRVSGELVLVDPFFVAFPKGGYLEGIAPGDEIEVRGLAERRIVRGAGVSYRDGAERLVFDGTAEHPLQVRVLSRAA